MFRTVRLSGQQLTKNNMNNKKWYLRWYMWIVYVVLVLIVLANIGSASNSNGAASQATVNTPQTPAQPPIRVSAIQLSSDYNANGIAADAKYKGKVVDVSGTVDTIDKDILNDPYVSLKTGQYSVLSVQCVFSQAAESKLTGLSSGQQVTLEGTVSGKTINVLLDGCSIVKQ
jgi:hypothetical protein